jgi:DNA-binding XRE family transcriptional regulator
LHTGLIQDGPFAAVSGYLTGMTEPDARRKAMEQVRREEARGGRSRSTRLPHLRELRQDRALTQRELGRLAGVSSGTVFRLESAKRGAYPTTMRKLASALGVPPAELARGRLL